MKRPYVFYFPSFTRSNGIRVMMILAETLEKEGFDVFYYVQNLNGWESAGHPHLAEISDTLRENGVIVYPEIVAGNPLRFRNVARYALYYPGVNGGQRRYHKSEMVFAYLPKFLPGANVLSIPWIDKTLFNDPGYERTGDCCFVYKGGRWCDPPELRSLPTITMQWPETREAFADLLKHTRTLYSFDAVSAVLDEAAVCGVKVKVVTKDGFKDYVSPHEQMVRDFPAQFRHFVDVTQNRDYRGPLQSRYLWLYWAYAVWRYWVKPWFVKVK